MIPRWIIGSLFGSKFGGDVGWSVPIQNTTLALLVGKDSADYFSMHFSDSEHEALLYCSEKTVINKTMLFRLLSQDMSLKAILSKARLPRHCSSAVLVDYRHSAITIHTIDVPSTLWSIGWDVETHGMYLFSGGWSSYHSHLSRLHQFTLPSDRDISFPMGLFEPNQNSPIVNMGFVNEGVQYMEICRELGKTVQNTAPSATIVVDSDMSRQYHEHSLPYWLDLCNISLPVIYTQPLSTNPINEHDRNSTTSLCKVRYVTGTQAICDLTQIHGHNCVSSPMGQLTPTCIEDVLTYVARRSACEHELNNTRCVIDQDSWSQCRLPLGVVQRSHLHFLSSMGFSTLLRRVLGGAHGEKSADQGSSTAMDALFRMAVQEVVTVVRAFAHTECVGKLSIHTFSSPAAGAEAASLSHSGSQVPLSRLFVNMLLVFDGDAQVAERFVVALSVLRTATTWTPHFNQDYNSTTLEQAERTLAAVVTHGLYVLDALHTAYGVDCTRLLTTCTATTTLTRASRSYLCVSTEAQEALAQLLDAVAAHLTAAAAGKADHDGSKVDVNLATTLADKISMCMDVVRGEQGKQITGAGNAEGTGRHVDEHRSVAQNRQTHKYGTVMNIHSHSHSLNTDNKPLVRIFIDGDVHVLIFVRDEHVVLAQRLVAYWQQHGAEITNFLFVRYLIVPLSSVGGESVGDRKKGSFYTHMPSLRAVLNLVSEKIEQFVTVKDIVYVLVGVEALLSFPQPGRFTLEQLTQVQRECRRGELTRSQYCDANVLLQSGGSGGLREQPQCDLCDNQQVQQDPCAYLEGVVPSIPYGGSGAYALDAKIVFSATATGGRGDINPHAFVGLGHTILHLVHWLRAQSDWVKGTQHNIAALMARFVEQHPSLVSVDCQQRAFHAGKASYLMKALTSSYAANFAQWGQQYHQYVVTAEHLPSTNQLPLHREQLRVTNDSVVQLLQVLSTPVMGALVDSRQRHLYYADMHSILQGYLTSDEAGLKRIKYNLKYGGEILPFLHLDKLPYIAGIGYQQSTSAEVDTDGNTKTECKIDSIDLQILLDYTFKELYLPSKIFASTLATLGTMEQVVRCECDDKTLALNELAHSLVKTGLTVRHVTCFVPRHVLALTAALLDAYEHQLLSVLGNNNTTTAAGVYGVQGSTHSHPDTDQGRRFYYRSLPTAQIEQIFTAVRFLRANVMQELAIFPDTTEAMAATINSAAFGDVASRREEWHKQRAVLQQALQRQQWQGGKFSQPSSAPPLSPQASLPTHWKHDEAVKPPAIDNDSSAELRWSPHIHFVTYASSDQPGLQNLLMSAELAGIPLQVLGLGTEYKDYSSKTDAYWSFLHNGTTTTTTTSTADAHPETEVKAPADDDLMLLMDAYDVLLFPALANAAAVLAQAPTSLIFCSERGIYPEFHGTYFYQRGASDLLPANNFTTSHTDGEGTTNGGDETQEQFWSAEGRPATAVSSAQSQKFLNSGCILGRVGQMKRLLDYAKHHGRTYRDDQLAMVRYWFEHPDQISIDSGNKLFLTNFKRTSQSDDLYLSSSLALEVGDRPIGLLHCNNMRSGSNYDGVVDGLRLLRNEFYSGPDGRYLLRAVHLHAAGQHDAAIAALQHPVVLRNCTSQGGVNRIRQVLLQKWNGTK